MGNAFLSSLSLVLCKTLRIERKNTQGIDSLLKQKKNFILVFWHGTMLLPWYLHKDRNFAALVSKSKDGELLARMLEKWNYLVIRGSSNDGGKEALIKMKELAAKGFILCVTPDGPKGPFHKFKPGAVITAIQTKTPLVLCGVRYEKKRQLRSWDKFEIPCFFSKAMVVYSDPFGFDAEFTRKNVDETIARCEKEMNDFFMETVVENEKR